MGRCLTGFGDCDRSPANGCESPLNAPVNCGTCGHACSLANATTGCAAGACSIASCNAGYGDCNHDPSDGCEAALNTSAICGACGMVCTTGMHCASGTCVTSCPSGTTSCTASGVCADTVRDPTNCGACGTACPLAANALVTCSSGACGYTCSTGYADCDGVASNGCETNLNTDVANCGSCRQRCNLPNSTAVCTDGVCAMGTCAVGFGDCDGNPANGCEVNITSSVFSCGTCNNTCSLTNAMAGAVLVHAPCLHALRALPTATLGPPTAVRPRPQPTPTAEPAGSSAPRATAALVAHA